MARDLGNQSGRGAWVVLQARYMTGQVPTFDELHAEVRLIVFLADLVDRDDVGVVEIGDRLGLVPEAAQVVRAGQRTGPDQLDGDKSIELFLTSSVDDPHPAAGDLFDELIFTQEAREPAGRMKCQRYCFCRRGLCDGSELARRPRRGSVRGRHLGRGGRKVGQRDVGGQHRRQTEIARDRARNGCMWRLGVRNAVCIGGFAGHRGFVFDVHRWPHALERPAVWFLSRIIDRNSNDTVIMYRPEDDTRYATLRLDRALLDFCPNWRFEYAVSDWLFKARGDRPSFRA